MTRATATEEAIPQMRLAFWSLTISIMLGAAVTAVYMAKLAESAERYGGAKRTHTELTPAEAQLKMTQEPSLSE